MHDGTGEMGRKREYAVGLTHDAGFKPATGTGVNSILSAHFG
jgi:hypothetical protein